MIIGIDPGMTGAFAVISEKGEFIGVHDMPTMPKGKPQRKRIRGVMKTVQRRQLDPRQLYQLMIQYIVLNRNYDCIFLEEVTAGVFGRDENGEQKKQGSVSAFGFGDSFGVCRSVSSLIGGSNFHLVRPATWKGATGLTGLEKDAARLKAIELFPAAHAFLTRKKDSGRADALMIAHYARISGVENVGNQ